MSLHTQTDELLIDVFATLLERAIKSGQYNMPVIQLPQPTQQARTELGAAVYFQLLFDDRLGWAKSHFEYDKAAHNFIETEEQAMSATIQVSVLRPGVGSPTAKDIANYLAQRMNSRNYNRMLRAAGIGVLRITKVRNPHFENDQARFEFMPNFDIEITFSRTLHETVPVIDSVQMVRYRV